MSLAVSSLVAVTVERQRDRLAQVLVLVRGASALTADVAGIADDPGEFVSLLDDLVLFPLA